METEEELQKHFEFSIYFGSCDHEVSLTPVAGYGFKYECKSLEQSKDNASRLTSLSFRNAVGYLGKEYVTHFLPCIPAFDIHQSLSLSKLTQSPSELSDVKEIDENSIYSTPMVKTSKATSLIGFRSGKRSAIVESSKGNFIRLKGCGNLLEGFPLSFGRVNLDPNSEEIRGCQFFHTAKRELFMSARVNEVLKPFGGACGNIPIGYWHYDRDFESGDRVKDLDLKNERKKIGKFCGLFKTLGEKRLATHLLQGLEMIMFTLCSDLGQLLDMSKVKEVFSKDRVHLIKEGADGNSYTFDITPIPVDEYEGDFTLKQQCEKGFFKLPEEEKNYVNLLGIKNISDIICKNLNCPKEQIQKSLCNLGKKAELSEKYRTLYELIIERFLKLLPEGNPMEGMLLLLSKIYARIGWETGLIKRIFINEGLNWGYYLDHHPYLAHCNAHPNNFVVLPEGFSENLLAPVDFDMAFEQGEFINIDQSDNSYGEYDKGCFERYLRNEKYNFELLLTGAENMENFKYNDFIFKNASPEQQQQYEALSCMLRDTLRIFYMRGFEEVKQSQDEALRIKGDQVLHSLVKLSLLLTNKYLG